MTLSVAQNFELLLSDSHAVVVHHRAHVSPHRVRELTTMFGKVCQCDAYALRDGTYATLACFDDATACQRCYHTLRAVLRQDTSALVNVGWAHEDSVRLFQSKPYVKEAFDWVSTSPNTKSDAPPLANAPLGEAKALDELGEDNECLLVYLLRASADERRAIESVAQARSLQYFIDDKEGGRLFMCFRDYDTADEFRQRFVDSLPHLQRDISLVDPSSYQLARCGSATNGNA